MSKQTDNAGNEVFPVTRFRDIADEADFLQSKAGDWGNSETVSVEDFKALCALVEQIARRHMADGIQ